jgi:S1-C subfamily serine protease
VTETGVIATNAHVARGDSTLVALLPARGQLPAKVVYIDATLDIALFKATVPSAHLVFPRLALADTALVHQGERCWPSAIPGTA